MDEKFSGLVQCVITGVVKADGLHGALVGRDLVDPVAVLRLQVTAVDGALGVGRVRVVRRVLAVELEVLGGVLHNEVLERAGQRARLRVRRRTHQGVGLRSRTGKDDRFAVHDLAQPDLRALEVLVRFQGGIWA